MNNETVHPPPPPRRHSLAVFRVPRKSTSPRELDESPPAASRLRSIVYSSVDYSIFVLLDLQLLYFVLVVQNCCSGDDMRHAISKRESPRRVELFRKRESLIGAAAIFLIFHVKRQSRIIARYAELFEFRLPTVFSSPRSAKERRSSFRERGKKKKLRNVEESFLNYPI